MRKRVALGFLRALVGRVAPREVSDMRCSRPLALLVALALWPLGAFADPIPLGTSSNLTVNSTAGDQVQQTDHHPCLYGQSNCSSAQQSPAGWPGFVKTPAGAGDSFYTFDQTSLGGPDTNFAKNGTDYTLGLFRTLFGTEFNIVMDINQTGSPGGTPVPLFK